MKASKMAIELVAHEAYLRASNYYNTAYFPLFGYPVDSRLISAFNKEVEVFQKELFLIIAYIKPSSLRITATKATLGGL
jgi:hypothetical protein